MLITVIKTGIVLFLIVWFILGGWLISRYNVLFGPNADDPSESPGARSFGIAHIVAVWIGGTALAVYFLFK